jgi:DNA-binding MarR family transcriptional regulator
VVDEKGERRAVIMPTEEHEKLIEDLHDLAVIAEQKDESTFPLDEIVEKLKKNDILSSTSVYKDLARLSFSSPRKPSRGAPSSS